MKTYTHEIHPVMGEDIEYVNNKFKDFFDKFLQNKSIELIYYEIKMHPKTLYLLKEINQSLYSEKNVNDELIYYYNYYDYLKIKIIPNLFVNEYEIEYNK